MYPWSCTYSPPYFFILLCFSERSIYNKQYDEHIKGCKIRKSCSTGGKNDKYMQSLSQKTEQRNRLAQKYAVRVWNGFIWLRIASSGELL
jgi:hypothetical protein